MHHVVRAEPRHGSSPSESRIRPILLAALLILVALGLCGYPNPIGSTPRDSARQSPGLSLILNIPAFRLDVWEDSQLVRSYRVAVGMRRYKTPTGDFEIARVVWNPWWYPPDAEWAAQDTVTPPGPRNPMGKVKLLLNGPYYLHGTPLVSSLGRTASHGCVRMRSEDAVELARLVQRHGGVEVANALMDSLAAEWKKTRVFTLSSLIPVTIVYRMAEVRDSALILYPDVYRRHTEGRYALAMLALFDAGVDTISVDTQIVRHLAGRASRSIVSVPIHQLIGRVIAGGH